MKAMVMAAGLGTRLRPLTYEVPKPLVPVGNRPVFELILRLLRRQGFTDVIANLHWYPDMIRERLGDGSSLGIGLMYSYEESLLGTAGGVRNVREYFGSNPFLVMAADALTDVDVGALADAHRANGGIATLAVTRVQDTSEYGVVVTGADGRVQGFQEKPDPAEALSDLANCMIYVLDPEVFDYFPDQLEVDFALDVFPALLSNDVPFHVHVTDAYWNDVGSLPEFLQGNLDALAGAVAVQPAGEVVEGEADVDGGDPGINGRVLIGEGAEVDPAARIDGPAVIGPGARIGAGAMVRESVLLPGAEIAPQGLLAGSIAGRRGALA
jgi:mannose-1-phosphate guanylyltransferase/mannose-1-phosphate guanylyltransferase/phosphomannomutase